MKNKKSLLNYLFLLAVSFYVSESSGQCNVTVQPSATCSIPVVFTVSAGFPVARMEWRRNGNLVRVDSVKYPTQGVTVAGGNGSGSGANQTGNPAGVFTDSLGNLYVCEGATNRVTKRAPGVLNGTVVAGGGSTSLSQLFRPQNCYVNGAGYLFVADKSNHRILRFNPGSAGGDNGVVIAGGNGSGNALNQFNDAFDFHFDASGNLYVSDLNNYRVLRFPPGSTSSTMGTVVAGGNGSGSALNQMFPQGIHVDASGNLFVADRANARILKFPPGSTSSTMGTVVAGGNGVGTGLNQITQAYELHVDKLGYIYVADHQNDPGTVLGHRILRFPPNSTSATSAVLIAGGNGRGSALNQHPFPSVNVSDSGHVFICEYLDNHRVVKYKATITDTFTATVAGTYTVTVTGFNGCVTTETMVVGSGVTYTSGTNPAVCAGGTSATLALSSVTGAPDQHSIIWSSAAQTAGFTHVSNQPLSGSSVNITVPATAAPATYTGMLTLRNSSTGCSSSPANISVVVSLNGPTFTPGSNPSVCAGATGAVITFSGATGSPNQYSIAWNTAAQTAGFMNVTNLSLSGSSVNIAVPATAAPATYSGTLTMRNSTTGCIGTPGNIGVVVSALPVATVSPSGPVSICAGQTETLTAGSGTGYSYQWKDGQSVVGNGASYAAGATGSYYVVVTNANNCKDSSAAVSVTQLALPQVNITPGDTAFCIGGYVRLDAVSSDTGIGYQWKEGNSLLPATAGFLEVDSSGSYSVVVTRNHLPGCADSALPVVVTVHPLPLPSVTWDGTMLHTESYYATYQWYTGSQPVAGATNASYTPVATGAYSVAVTDSNGCHNSSAAYTVNQLSGLENIRAADIRIFPNPAADAVHVQAPSFVRVTLRDMNGKIACRYEGVSLTIPVRQLPDGLFIMELTDQHGQFIRREKLVKQSR